ncbi:hypothetical protein DFP73DRAFT_220311 [Morchella snyderi]|nr:hypothetical protein DFP73DRAFT_220311 [Morchella snyderi]
MAGFYYTLESYYGITTSYIGVIWNFSFFSYIFFHHLQYPQKIVFFIIYILARVWVGGLERGGGGRRRNHVAYEGAVKETSNFWQSGPYAFRGFSSLSHFLSVVGAEKGSRFQVPGSSSSSSSSSRSWGEGRREEGGGRREQAGEEEGGGRRQEGAGRRGRIQMNMYSLLHVIASWPATATATATLHI